MALLIAGYEQSFVERAVGGSTWASYFAGQTHPWFVQAMFWRMIFGWVTAAGTVLLIWDLVTIGAGETRAALVHEREEDTKTGTPEAPAVA